MKNNKKLLFLIDNDFNGYNTINDCIYAWLKENELNYIDILQQIYLDFFSYSDLNSSFRYVYKIEVRKRCNSRGFEVLCCWDDKRAVSNITNTVF